jgi:hypothetical protein
VSLLFGELAAPVRMVVVTDPTGGAYCDQVREMADELASLSDKIELELVDRATDPSRAAAFGIDKLPAIAGPAGQR